MSDQAEGDSATGRMQLVRDIATLQVKLIVDGFRDLLLVPASLVAGLVSLAGGGKSDDAFYDLLRLGKRSEKWINLFGAVDRVDAGATGQGQDIDRAVERVEKFLVDEYRHGRLTGQARESVERSISRLREATRRRGDS